MIIDSNEVNPPLEPTEDKIHRMIRAGLGFLPVGSGTAVELFNSLFIPPIEKRRNEWMHDVAASLKALEDNQKCFVPSLVENEEFISTLLSATQLAIKNHTKEKLNSFKNIVLNKGCGLNYGESLETIFLHFVDKFSPLHIRLLKIFHEGLVWNNRNKMKPNDEDLPDWLLINVASTKEFEKIDRPVIALCLKDLISNSFIQHWIINKINKKFLDSSFSCEVAQWGARGRSEMHVKHGVSIKVDQIPGNFVTETTNLGKKFITFISTPV